MSSNQYVFLTQWQFDATPTEVFAIIEDTESYPRWWGQVWLQVERIEEGDSNTIGRRYRLLSKGWLPYKLRWESRTLEKIEPSRIKIEAKGDFDGHGIWTFEREGEVTNVRYDWQLKAEKPVLKYLSWILKPLFRWNHGWAMDRGFEAIKRELVRRRESVKQAA